MKMNCPFKKPDCQPPFKKPAGQNGSKNTWPNHRAFSLVELLTVIGIIGVLSVIAVPSYIQYKKRPYELWVANELTEQSQFLNLAYSVDGGYHQYLPAMGYWPSGKQLGNAGFDYSSTDPPCCPNYPDPNTDDEDDEDDFNHFTYIKHKNKSPKDNNGNHVGWEPKSRGACFSAPNCSHDLPWLPIHDFTHHEIKNAGSCNYALKKADCDCDKFTLIGVTNYGKNSRITKVSEGTGILALDNKGQLCKADENGDLQPF